MPRFRSKRFEFREFALGLRLCPLRQIAQEAPRILNAGSPTRLDSSWTSTRRTPASAATARSSSPSALVRLATERIAVDGGPLTPRQYVDTYRDMLRMRKKKVGYSAPAHVLASTTPQPKPRV